MEFGWLGVGCVPVFKQFRLSASPDLQLGGFTGKFFPVPRQLTQEPAGTAREPPGNRLGTGREPMRFPGGAGRFPSTAQQLNETGEEIERKSDRKNVAESETYSPK